MYILKNSEGKTLCVDMGWYIDAAQPMLFNHYGHAKWWAEECGYTDFGVFQAP